MECFLFVIFAASTHELWLLTASLLPQTWKVLFYFALCRVLFLFEMIPSSL